MSEVKPPEFGDPDPLDKVLEMSVFIDDEPELQVVKAGSFVSVKRPGTPESLVHCFCTLKLKDKNLELRSDTPYNGLMALSVAYLDEQYDVPRSVALKAAWMLTIGPIGDRIRESAKPRRAR